MEGVDVPCYFIRFDRIPGIIMSPVPDFEVLYVNMEASFPGEDDSDVVIVLSDFI